MLRELHEGSQGGSCMATTSRASGDLEASVIAPASPGRASGSSFTDHAGIAQLPERPEPAPGHTPPEGAGETPAPRSILTPAQVMTKALGIDRTAWAVGRIAGAIGAPWRCPEGLDLLSWAVGYADGQRFGVVR
jgi:hypothetical protein